jgi:hypothetical protein
MMVTTGIRAGRTKTCGLMTSIRLAAYGTMPFLEAPNNQTSVGSILC